MQGRARAEQPRESAAQQHSSKGTAWWGTSCSAPLQRNAGACQHACRGSAAQRLEAGAHQRSRGALRWVRRGARTGTVQPAPMPARAQQHQGHTLPSVGAMRAAAQPALRIHAGGAVPLLRGEHARPGSTFAARCGAADRARATPRGALMLSRTSSRGDSCSAADGCCRTTSTSSALCSAAHSSGVSDQAALLVEVCRKLEAQQLCEPPAELRRVGPNHAQASAPVAACSCSRSSRSSSGGGGSIMTLSTPHSMAAANPAPLMPGRSLPLSIHMNACYEVAAPCGQGRAARLTPTSVEAPGARNPCSALKPPRHVVPASCVQQRGAGDMRALRAVRSSHARYGPEWAQARALPRSAPVCGLQPLRQRPAQAAARAASAQGAAEPAAQHGSDPTRAHGGQAWTE